MNAADLLRVRADIEERCDAQFPGAAVARRKLDEGDYQGWFPAPSDRGDWGQLARSQALADREWASSSAKAKLDSSEAIRLAAVFAAPAQPPHFSTLTAVGATFGLRLTESGGGDGLNDGAGWSEVTPLGRELLRRFAVRAPSLRERDDAIAEIAADLRREQRRAGAVGELLRMVRGGWVDSRLQKSAGEILPRLRTLIAARAARVARGNRLAELRSRHPERDTRHAVIREMVRTSGDGHPEMIDGWTDHALAVARRCLGAKRRQIAAATVAANAAADVAAQERKSANRRARSGSRTDDRAAFTGAGELRHNPFANFNL